MKMRNNKSKMSCQICTEKYTKVNRKKIVCIYCNFDCCLGCIKNYTLNSQDIHCMNPKCKKVFSSTFIQSVFPKSWLNKEYKKHIVSILYSKEIPKLPETQLFMKNEKDLQLINRQLYSANSELYSATRKINWNQSRMQRLNPESKTHKKLKEDNKTFENLADELRILINELNEKKMKIGETAACFVYPCPREACKGFLDTQWKCGMCNGLSCKRCHEPRDDEHKCNPEVVESVKLLKRDTKPCPSCGSSIFKIEGCDQMWCTQCKVAFSWSTGEIVKSGIVHNPHFFEWQRQQGIEQTRIGENDCQTLPATFTMLQNSVYKGHCEYFYPMHRFLGEVQGIIQENQRYLNSDYNRKHRIGLLGKKLNEDKFKSRILFEHRNVQRTIEITQILEMFMTVSTEIFHRMRTSKDIESMRKMFRGVLDLVDYINPELVKIGKYWNVKSFQVKIHTDMIKYKGCLRFYNQRIRFIKSDPVSFDYSKFVQFQYNQKVMKSIFCYQQIGLLYCKDLNALFIASGYNHKQNDCVIDIVNSLKEATGREYKCVSVDSIPSELETIYQMECGDNSLYVHLYGEKIHGFFSNNKFKYVYA